MRATSLRLDPEAVPRSVAVLGVVSVASGLMLAACVSRPSPPTETTRPKTLEKTVPTPASSAHSVELRRTLLKLARSALELAVRERKHLELPADLASSLLEKKGSFVTLTVAEQLRGCIGNIYPEMPLAEAVTTNAYRAALNDPRFSPVTPDELSRIEIEVSVLTVPEPLVFDSPADLLRKLTPNRDGVVLQIGSRRSTFLPQVWEKLPEPSRFLDQLSAKAGLPAQAWRQPGTEVLIYHVEAFTEAELHEAGK